MQTRSTQNESRFGLRPLVAIVLRLIFYKTDSNVKRLNLIDVYIRIADTSIYVCEKYKAMQYYLIYMPFLFIYFRYKHS